MTHNFLHRIDEDTIKNRQELIGHKEIFDICFKVFKFIHTENDNTRSELFEELDIRSIFLFYGQTGVGKTTLAYTILKDALELGIESYKLLISRMIETNLGNTLKNFEKAWEEIRESSKKSKNGIVVFMDEFDRFEVNRNQDNEVSELKRAFVSLMDFIESIKSKDKITIVCTTNNYANLDPALRRRFSFAYELECSSEMKKEYIINLKEKLRSFEIEIGEEIIEEAKNIAELKKKIRDIVINCL